MAQAGRNIRQDSLNQLYPQRPSQLALFALQRLWPEIDVE